MKKIINIIIPTLLPLLLGLPENTAFSQAVTQTVKGKIFDNVTQAPLEGATAVIVDTPPLL